MEQTLTDYLERNVITMYRRFDPAHRTGHVRTVIRESLKLARFVSSGGTSVSEDMVLAVAAYHDTGISVNRENHHRESARIVLEDRHLDLWFSRKEIQTIAEAVEDHRASAGKAPRSIYGKIVADADHYINPDTVIRRALQYGMRNFPELCMEGQFLRTAAHVRSKYGTGGYLNLWLDEPSNSKRLGKLREICEDDRRLRESFDRQWELVHRR